jgi:Tol biopolymer transport system component
MGPSRNSSPSVSPDGRSIGFVSTRDGNQEIYTMSLDGSSQRRITKSSVRESSPHFFPSGELLYVTERGGKSKGSRVVRQPSKGNPVVLIQTDEPVASVALSRDGERLAYVVARLADAAKGRVEFNLFLQPTAAGSKPVAVPLRPGEQVLNPSF